MGSTVLIDNSTYFCFKQILNGEPLDADAVYNAATFVECLVTADEVVTSPTLAWQPNHTDELFAANGPCRTLKPAEVDDATLRSVFRAAIDRSESAIGTSPIRRLLKIDHRTQDGVRALLKQWKHHSLESPRDFLNIYSGAVLLTDRSSKRALAEIETVVSAQDRAERHFAQYLLRTNSALEFAGALEQGIPYHPHSFRANYVSLQLTSIHRNSHALAAALIRELEERVTIFRREMAAGPLDHWAATIVGDDAPLILEVVLSGTRDRTDIPNLALEIRNGGPARRFRQFVRQVVQTGRSNDPKEQRKAIRQLQSARQVLDLELKKLYGLSRCDPVSTASVIAGGLDLEALADTNTRKLVIETAKHIIGKSPKLRDVLETALVRRKIAFLFQLAKKAAEEKQLNDLLEKVFGQKLSDSDMVRLKELRKLQRASVKRLLSVADTK